MRDLLETLRRVLMLGLACALLLAGGQTAAAQTGTAPQAEPPSELWKAFPLEPEQGQAEPIPPSADAPPSGVGIGLEQPAGARPSGSNPSFRPPILLGVALAVAVLLACVLLTRGGALPRLAHELRELGQPGGKRMLEAPSSLLSIVAVAPRALSGALDRRSRALITRTWSGDGAIGRRRRALRIADDSVHRLRDSAAVLGRAAGMLGAASLRLLHATRTLGEAVLRWLVHFAVAVGRSVASASIRVSRTFVAASRALDGHARSFPAALRRSNEAAGRRTLRPLSALGKSGASLATAARGRATSAAKAGASLRREHGQAVLFYSALMLMSCALGVLVAYVLNSL